jgi:general secretion pathway protein J
MKRRIAIGGFTLLELLVALAIFAVLATMAYAALNSVLTARKQVEAKSARLSALQTALMIMERDVEQAVPRGIRDEFGDVGATPWGWRAAIATGSVSVQ